MSKVHACGWVGVCAVRVAWQALSRMRVLPEQCYIRCVRADAAKPQGNVDAERREAELRGGQSLA